MTDALYLRLKSLNTRTVRGVTSPKNIVRVAAMHNLREIQAELGASAASGINPARMHLNYQLRGPATADEVAGLALALLDNAGVQTLRRDACMAVELVVSLPASANIDHREYFAAAVAWADAHFNVPILSAAVHLDEAAPHCHILLLPLVAGRMQGGALAGGPAKIRAMLADFQQQVAQRFGLTHQPRAKRLSKPNRDAAGRMVLDALRARPERLSEPAMRDALIVALGGQAETLLALLGLGMPATKAKAKSFADIMTAPCKPERTGRAAPNTKHIDFAQNLGNQGCEKFDNVYVSVDVGTSPSSIAAPEQPLPPAAERIALSTDRNTSGQSQTGTTAHSQLSFEPRIDQRQHSAENLAQPPSAAAHHSNRTNFVRLVEQREGGADQRQQDDTRLSFQDGPAASDEKRTKAPAHGMQNILDTQAANQRQQSGNAPPAQCALRHTVSMVQAGAGKFSDTPTTPATGGSLRSARPSYPPAGSGDYQRQRDNDHPASTWCRDRGEFVQATGPPSSACHLYP